jgi:hypothetical protein
VAHENGAILPFLTLADFEPLAAASRNSSGAQLLAYAPLILDAPMRAVWEEFSLSASDWLEPAYEFYGITNANPVLPREFIWGQYEEGTLPAPPDTKPFSPSWQMSPPPLNPKDIVNYDYSSSTLMASVLDWTVFTKNPMLSAPISSDNFEEFEADTLPLNQEVDPKSAFLQPVYESLEKPSTIVGHILSILPWMQFFEGILRSGQNGVVVVAESCGTNFTYEIDGGEAIFVGSGDRHESKFDSYVRSAPFASFGTPAQHLMTGYCKHTLYVFPTEDLWAAYASNNAGIYTAVVVGVLLLAAILFLFYDSLIRRRRDSLGRQAKQNQAHAMINAMPPPAIEPKTLEGDRTVEDIFKGEENINEDLENTATVDHTKDVLMKYVTGGQKVNQDPNSKPIADLFPETTILFADISGFTAWSSIREPSQVFMLLETIFGAFDTIAHARGVFKVETVGDW